MKTMIFLVCLSFATSVFSESYTTIDKTNMLSSQSIDLYSSKYELEQDWGCRWDDNIKMEYVTYSLSNPAVEGYAASKKKSSFLYLFFDNGGDPESSISEDSCEKFVKQYLDTAFTDYNNDNFSMSFIVEATRIETNKFRSFKVNQVTINKE